ncbi:MAG: hypothetical protein JSW26_06370, partial [Desulfobacterales bacterium]
LNVEHRTSNVQWGWRYALSVLKKSESNPATRCGERILTGRFDRTNQALAPYVVQYFFKLTKFHIRCWTLDVRCSTFISFFFDQTSRCLGRRLSCPPPARTKPLRRGQ